MDFILGDYTVRAEGIEVHLKEMPLLRCSKCCVIQLPDKTEQIAEVFARQAIERGTHSVEVNPTRVLAKRRPRNATPGPALRRRRAPIGTTGSIARITGVVGF
jgi:hypothetical protein